MQNEERTLTIKGEGMARGQKVEIKELPMNKIKLGRNSRLSISKEDLSGLMESIKATGLLQPIGVVKNTTGGYEVAYGNRRFMAFTKLGFHSIPAVIHESKKESDVDVKNLAENVQRRNISLAEIGRYAAILEGEDMGRKELAVRLGTSVKYIDDCLAAYRLVPEEFRDDLEVNLAGKKIQPGKISIKAARAIINAGKSHGANSREKTILFKAAKKDGFSAEMVPKYVAALKRGSKDPINDVEQVKVIHCRFMMAEKEYESLMRVHIENGPFLSFTGLIQAILKGEKAIVLKTVVAK